ncbi:ABC transporter permease [Mesotoga sp. UBA5557]|jgi:putative ABC transport system permease protein|uniref:ABC transporter permease n=1 Tax=Mesotoga sp. UBA5557 TaxID=1946857 RepID=UPI0025CC57B3|nr:FtsX-like permease family protein [Mesotoga sp. UBA5557]
MLKYMWLYLRRRPGRILVFIFVVALGVSMSLVISSIFLSFGETRSRIAKINESWITVQYLSESGRDESIDNSLTEIFEDVFGLSDVIPVDIAYLGYNLFGSARANFPVYGIKQTEISRMLRESNAYISEGTVFSPGTNEIIVSDSFLRASGVDLKNVYEEISEMSSVGLYTVVASLEGPSVFGLGPSGISRGRGSFGFLVFAEDGFLMAVENELRSRIIGEELSVSIEGPVSSRETLERQYATYYLGVFLTNLFVSLVFIIALTMLNSVSIRERRKEYAILTAIGHSPASLKVRLFLESLYQGIAGWILGLLAGGAVLSLFEDRFFTPNGLYIGDSAVSSICTLFIPFTTIVLSQILIGRHLRRDLVGLLKSSEERVGLLKKRFRNIGLPWLQFPLRSDGYRSLFVNIIAFAALVTVFGSLLSSLTGTVRDSGWLFDRRSYIQTSELEEFTLPEEISLKSTSVLPADLLELDVKLMFGATKLFIPVVSAEHSRLLSILGENPVAGTLYVSKGLFDLIVNGSVRGLDYSSMEVLPNLESLAGVLVQDRIESAGLLVLYDDRNLAGEIRSFASEAGQVELVDRKTFELKIRAETQFMELISSIIIYLQLIVVIIIGLVTVTRVTLARRSEISIRNILGQSRDEIGLLFFGELSLVLFLGAATGYLLTTICWQIFRLVFLRGLYISSIVVPETLFRISVMTVIVLLAGVITARFLISKQDPISIIER